MDTSVPAQRAQYSYMFALHVETLRWGSGVYLLILGMSFLLLPQARLGIWLQPIWLPGAGLVAAGLANLWLAVLTPPRPIALALSLLFALPLFAITIAYLIVGVLPAAVTLGLIGVGMLVAPLAAPTDAVYQPRPDALGLVLGAAVVALGVDFLLRPASAGVIPSALHIPVLSISLVLLASGSAVIVTQLIPQLPSAVRWLAHVTCGLVVLGLQVTIALFIDPLYWVLGTATILRGIATIILPWWSWRAAQVDRAAFRPRVALALITAALLPVIITLPIVLAALPQQGPAFALAQQIAFGSTLAVMLLTGIGGWLLAGSLSAALTSLMNGVNRIAKGQHKTALPQQGPTEVMSLSQAVEEMAQALELRAQERALLLDQERQARAAAETAAERTARLQQVSALLVTALTPEQVVRIALNQGIAALEAHAGTVVVWTADGTMLEVLDAIGYPSEVRQQWQQFPLSSSTPLSDAIKTEQPILVESRSAGAVRYPALAKMEAVFGDGAIVAFPLMVRNQVIGGLGMSFLEPRMFTPSEIAFIANLVQQCAQALERAQLYQSEQQARSAAEEAIRTRDTFLSVAAHELKNPLTALLGNAQVLQRRAARSGTFTERDQRTLVTITEQAARMNRMIAALFDLSQLDTGQLHLERSPVELIALIHQVLDELQPTLERHTISEHLPASSILIEGDEIRLLQVMHNLLGNAVKYSPQGGAITVRVTQSDGQVFVAITDQGIGISAHTLPKVFQRFYRGGNTESQHTLSGIGVGLYVVKEIVTRHGGTIEVESQEGSGSTFTLCLPTKQEELSH